MEYRIEHDSMGEVKVPADRLWAAQTERSHENFRIGVDIETMPREITHAFGILKKAAAMANAELKPEKMTSEKLGAISQACDEVISGSLNDHFRGHRKQIKPDSRLKTLPPERRHKYEPILKRYLPYGNAHICRNSNRG